MTTDLAVPRSAPAATNRWLSRLQIPLEAIWATIAAFSATILVNWPVVTHLDSRIVAERSDPFMMAWRIAWPWRALTSDEKLWDSNTFYPEPYSFAYTDTLLGYAPFGIGISGPADAVLRYNLAYLFAFMLALLGGYALARQLGAWWPGAVLTGIAVTLAPWLLAQGNHLNIVSTGGIAFTFFALARGWGFSFTDGYQSEKVRPKWIGVGFAIACWQITLGFATGLVFGYVLGILTLIAIVGWFVVRPQIPRIAMIVSAAGWLGFLTVSYLMARPMLWVSDHFEAERTLPEVQGWSAPWQGLGTSPEQSWLWGDSHIQARMTLPFAGEQTLLPGYAIVVLGVVGLFYSTWRLWIRIMLGISAGLFAVFAIGTQFFDGTFTYLLLFDYVPGFNGMRVPGRLILWTILCLALLSAGAVTKFAQQFRPVIGETRLGKAALIAAALVPVLFASMEGYPLRPYPSVLKAPTAVTEVLAEGKPTLLLPMDPWNDSTYMLWSTRDYTPIVNGITGFFPPAYWETGSVVETFPDQRSIDYLRQKGVETVVVVTENLPGTVYQAVPDRSIDGLGISREDHEGTIIYRL